MPVPIKKPINISDETLLKINEKRATLNLEPILKKT